MAWNGKPVVIGMRLTGGRRFWFRNNPRDFSVIADNNVVLSVTQCLVYRHIIAKKGNF